MPAVPSLAALPFVPGLPAAAPALPSLLHAAVSALVAGVWISTATILAERLGSRTGALVANLPSNILVALAFVAASQGVGFVGQAVAAVPAGMAVDSLFLLAFALAVGRGLAVAVPASLAVWALSAWGAARWRPDALEGTVLYVAVTAACLAAVARGVAPRAHAGTPRRFTPGQMGVRAAFAATVVGGTVALAAVVPAYGVGLLATFPAVLLSTLVILARARGPAFAQAAAQVLLVSSSNILVYALGVHLAYPRLGIVAGTVAALALAAAYVAALRPLVRLLP